MLFKQYKFLASTVLILIALALAVAVQSSSVLAVTSQDLQDVQSIDQGFMSNDSDVASGVNQSLNNSLMQDNKPGKLLKPVPLKVVKARNVLLQHRRIVRSNKVLTNKYKLLRSQYLQQSKKFKRLKQKVLKAHNFNASKRFVIAVIDRGLKDLEILALKINNSFLSDERKEKALAAISRAEQELTGLRQEAVNAQTPEELRSIARKAKQVLVRVTTRARFALTVVLIPRFERVIAKAEIASDKLHNALDIAKNMTSVDSQTLEELERLLTSYDDNVQKADNHLQTAKQIVDELLSRTTELTKQEVMQELRNARKELVACRLSLRNAHKDLVRFVKLYKKEFKGLTLPRMREQPLSVRKRIARISGTGVLEAVGNGSARLQGDAKSIDIKLEGSLKVSNNAVFEFRNLEQVEVTQEYTVLRGNGSIFITGNDIWVELEGSNVVIKAQGTGTVWLKGSGRYWTNKAGGDWSVDGEAITLEPEASDELEGENS